MSLGLTAIFWRPFEKLKFRFFRFLCKMKMALRFLCKMKWLSGFYFWTLDSEFLHGIPYYMYLWGGCNQNRPCKAKRGMRAKSDSNLHRINWSLKCWFYIWFILTLTAITQSVFHVRINSKTFFNSQWAGLQKNVQIYYTRCHGSRAIAKTKV